MDVQLITSSVFDLPSSQRVDAIVHDGTTDLRTWPGPGPDRDLLEHYGPELPRVLERERERLEGGELPIGGMLRLHRGKLHCDFLLWVATRPPEERGIQAPAPREEVLRRAVKEALAFVAERHVARVAMGPLGAGPEELPEVDRLVLVARAANAYYDECFQAGRPAGIEEVLVCHPYSSRIAEARRKLGRSVQVVQPAPRPAAAEPKPKRRRVASGGRTSKAKKAPAKPKVRLAEEEIGRARASAEVYDRSREYAVGDYFVHPKFGVGRVEELTPEGFIMVLFEGGETRRLLHRRP
jgi:O-acetyl-ADP-ribose deacetylase (regulator of RNase III)